MRWYLTPTKHLISSRGLIGYVQRRTRSVCLSVAVGVVWFDSRNTSVVWIISPAFVDVAVVGPLLDLTELVLST